LVSGQPPSSLASRCGHVSYPVPENECERLDAPHSFDIIGSAPEPSLDRIITLAARLFHAPVAFISIFDKERQWFKAQWIKARHGSDAPGTSRALSFSAYTLTEKEPVVVCDAASDPRFQNNPVVIDEVPVRFYVGAPIRTRDGLALGSLSVIDSVGRERPPQDLLDSLCDLAFLIVEQLELRSSMDAKRDLTEQELRRSLVEKETLLREVHHRVKNNLQIVSSLLKLQGDSLADRTAAAALKESQQRVLSMAMIHERLYAGKQMAEIEFDDYARALVQGLVYSYAGRAGNVTRRLLPPSIRLGIGQAIPCGLILNELVTNALKYAYPDGRDGEVLVELHETPAGRIRLAVSDGGQGLPPDFDWKNTKSLGLRIVDVLTKQLGGTFTIDSGQRTSFILEFPRDDPKVANRNN
jgi:two-component sensor histidine kinase